MRDKNYVVSHPCIYKKRGRVYPSRPGSESTCRVDRVSPGQLPDGFLLRPGPVPGPGWPGLGSTRQAGPSFKTMAASFFFSWLFVFLSFNFICVEKERRKLNLWSCKIIYCRQTKKLWIMNLNLKLGRALWRSNKQWAFILD